MSGAIRVYVVDDHPVVREGLVSGIDRHEDMTVVGSAATAEDAMRELAGLAADVAVVDYALPGMDGAQLCARLAATPGPACLVLTGTDARTAVERCFEAGAGGYLLKDASMAVIAIAIRALARGETYVDPRITEMMRPADRTSGRSQLTERELRVLRLIAAGKSNSQIAEELHVSTGSAKNYVSRLLVKLDVTRRAEAVAKAAERGLL